MAWNTVSGADRHKWMNSQCTLAVKPAELAHELDERAEGKEKLKNDSKFTNVIL